MTVSYVVGQGMAEVGGVLEEDARERAEREELGSEVVQGKGEVGVGSGGEVEKYELQELGGEVGE